MVVTFAVGGDTDSLQLQLAALEGCAVDGGSRRRLRLRGLGGRRSGDGGGILRIPPVELRVTVDKIGLAAIKLSIDDLEQYVICGLS